MRPLELTLEGFKSYRTSFTFRFRDRRLVGVVGPIGAGKSSLLDAVAFALYGTTPSVGKETRSLIHQLCDSAHVELLFEVDGQLWRAQRGLRRKGQSGHKLERLDPDNVEGPPLESVQQERNVKERVERLLGMDFSAFCRSVLLAQDRFQEFLKATPTQRNEVLKGVFGYERFDAALAIAKDRVRDADADLKALELESSRLRDAQAQRDEAAERSREAAERRRRLDEAAPRVQTLLQTVAGSRRTREEQLQQAESLGKLVAALPDRDHLARSLDSATGATDAVTQAEKAASAAEEAARTAEAQLAAVSGRVGDRADFVAFARLVAEHDHQVQAAAIAADTATQAAAALEEANASAVVAREAEEAADRARTQAEEALQAAEAAVAQAESSLHEARHAEMAAELRSNLTVGAPCPVCDRSIATLPPEAKAPGVKKAEAGLAKVKRDRDTAQREHSAAQAALAATAARSAAAVAAVGRAESASAGATEAQVAAAAALEATKSELVDRLGAGDPHGLLQEREGELAAAETASRDAAEAARAARSQADQARMAAIEAGKQVTKLATSLTMAWAQIGESREIPAEPSSVRDAATQITAIAAQKIAQAEDAADRAAQAENAAAGDLAEEMASLGLEASADFAAERASAAALSAAADARLETLDQALSAGTDIAERILRAEQAKALAARLVSHMQPAQFLTYLLAEERAALAELGSHHLQDLTGGSYRFTSDDTFRIVDVNAGAAERSADSLSGGETFLASLALALALAEMVARSGGRLDAFFLDEGFGSLDAEHIERAMDGIGRLVSGSDGRLVVLVSHVEQMKQTLEDLIVLDKDPITGDTVLVSGATLSA